MKIGIKVFALLLTFAVGVGYTFAQGADLKAVYYKDGDLFTIGVDGEPRQLTHDGIPKGPLVWSRDGTKIAFLRKIDHAVAIDNLVVIDSETGRTLSDILIGPVSSGEAYPFDYIERIQWLTADTIAAAGNVNPSSDDTLVFDTKTGEELTDYLDDTGGPVFSPDGEHAAVEGGMPHWTPLYGREPELDIDYRRVYPAKGVKVTLLTKPAWSEDSKEVAVAAQDNQSKRASIVVCGLQGACESTALPAGKWDPDENYQIQWNGGRVYLTAPEGTWSSQRGDSTAAASSPPPDLKAAATGLTAGLREQIQKLGGKGPDFWCADCALAKLPREAPEN
ncbi:hypothetical protein [Candidatus Binatus sp.]|uniref:hypothetical protein n=1 Tax=Candidatus Binatus sp. TaxID=2811406 RepID=UPI003CA322A7